MPPINPTDNAKSIPLSKYLKWSLLIFTIVMLSAVSVFMYLPYIQEDIVGPLPRPVDAFSDSLVLSLATTVTDAQGIPYSGVVVFNPLSQTYAQIANTDEGNIISLGISAFTQGNQYLAMRNAASSSDLVVYNKMTLATDRVVTPVASGAIVGTTLWSANADKLGYLMVGTTKAELVVEKADGSNYTVLPATYPIGFSPDTRKLLVRGSPALLMIDIETKELTPTVGTAFADTEVELAPSRSGAYLVAYSEKQIDWYGVNWETAEIIHRGTIPSQKGFADVLFTPEDTLLVRENDSEIIVVHEYKEGQGLVQKNVFKVPLPEGADILKVITK
jgi:hypothetical protein